MLKGHVVLLLKCTSEKAAVTKARRHTGRGSWADAGRSRREGDVLGHSGDPCQSGGSSRDCSLGAPLRDCGHGAGGK